MAGACLQGVEQDLCMGRLMTPRERGSLTWPELSQDLSHSADEPPQWGGFGGLQGHCTFPHFLRLHAFHAGMCILHSLWWGRSLVFGRNTFLSCLLCWFLVTRCTIANPGYATPWKGKPDHICCTELPGWISIASLDNFPIHPLPDKRHYACVILELK